MRDLIIVTGGAGFIGSAVIWKLNREKFENILVVDSLDDSIKWKNLVGLKFYDYVEKDDFLRDITDGKYNRVKIDTIFHLGACSSTIHPDAKVYVKDNYEYSKILCKFSVSKNIRFIYASSAATYGDGSFGFSDDESQLEVLRPLNMYGYSKHLFDLWAKNNALLKKIVGLKYFNVFGPNEYHKAEMRSFVVKAFEQIVAYGKVKLFKSYLPEYKDGEQLRDFIYIKDAVNMTFHFFKNRNLFGIFNIGTGKPHSFNELVKHVFDAMGKEVKIEYIDMPESIKNQYQYYTCADIKKLLSTGYNLPVTDFGVAIHEYVKKYIALSKYLADYES
ncbi:MAG: ADP-glyceromanno-heptose 6-epimerase [Endomicrobia bacterium]|nr:ADP-glyceromanno-heptose 6-epimerase [Endomicrobiia bacterium]MCX7940975.1 ADP-glyceromanno-heptose 6-epimerase [Endomicrobiia bacterium]MDW8056164.1 ADP-glyceromanno-heptose 6-epimerase [Elusimicrobiota bacterium]